MESLIRCAQIAWQPQIGDPTLVGWLMTGAYLVLVLLILLLLARLRSDSVLAPRALVCFWFLVLFFYVALGINKQLDLQTFMTATGRCMAKVQGWYGERRALQIRLLYSGLVAASGGMLLLAFLFRSVILSCLVAIAGVGVSTMFVFLRSISLHHLDSVLVTRVLDVKVVVFIEFAGIALVFMNAIVMLCLVCFRRSQIIDIPPTR